MVMMNPEGKQNYLYLYDLPKDVATSTLLANLIKSKTGVVLSRMPQIRRDIHRPFYSAIITIPEEDKFQTACKELRYFELVQGKPSRGLPYDNDLLGSNPLKIVDHNIFVRKIPESMTPQQLEEFFSKYGQIKSLKISLNSDHTSRRYGFVCFQEPEGASNALKDRSNAEENQVIKYQPRDKRDFRKIYNNIYAKNFPAEWGEAEVRALFEKYGRIESLKFDRNEKGSYAFICYNSEDKGNREYGPECAERAVKELNGADEVNGVQLQDKKLYVKEALKKRDREQERLKETIKYKSSKKRCNLYVKGFPENITEQSLKDLFGAHGEIESLKLHPQGEGKKLYAFVCFKKPDEASTAKEKLHNTPFEGKTLTINHYEIKEIREMNNEAARDRNDFQHFRAQHNQGANWSGLANQEDIQYYLKLLIEHFPTLIGGQRPRSNMMGQGGNVGGNPGQNRMQGRQDMQNRGPRQGGQKPYGHNKQMMHPNMGGQQQMHPQQMQQQQIHPQQMQQPQQLDQQNLPIQQRFNIECYKIFGAINEQNPNYKDQAGTLFYNFVKELAQPARAPKITGMLIDLPINDIKQMMSNFDHFTTRVNQANDVLTSQENSANQAQPDQYQQEQQ